MNPDVWGGVVLLALLALILYQAAGGRLPAALRALLYPDDDESS